MKRIALFVIIITVCTALVIGAVYSWKRFKSIDELNCAQQHTINIQAPTQPLNILPQSRLVKQVYGHSGDNCELELYRISSIDNPNKKLLCVFALHGFEDAFYQDGRLLTDTAQALIAHFKDHNQELGSYELLVVPCANPDGAARGWTCNGPGRCQMSLGIDMNMDFDYNFKPKANARNLTASRPFAAPESRALRNLVLTEKPDIVIDFHGWVNSAAGDKEIASVFCRLMGLSFNTEEGSIRAGYFSGWAGKYARAVLIEYPDPFTGHGAYEGKTEFKIDYTADMLDKLGYGPKTVECIKEVIKQTS